MASSLSSSAERSPSIHSVETKRLIVGQPAKMVELNKLLDTFDNLSARVGERTSEDSSGDLGGAGAGATAGQQGAQGKSARDLAIQKIPMPEIMQQKLALHIRQETRRLERLARQAARRTGPGSAHQLNAVYAKIRRLHALVYEILDASLEVLKRLFVRVFIDQQPIL